MYDEIIPFLEIKNKKHTVIPWEDIAGILMELG